MPNYRRASLVAFALTCGLIWSSSALAQADKTYPVKLNRPAKVGDKAKVSGTAKSEQTMTMSMGGQAMPAKTETTEVVYEGQSEVLAVNDKGIPTKIAVTFDKCALTADGEKSDAVAKGAVVTIERKDGKATYTLKEGELSDAAQKTLDLADLSPDPDSDDDASFGTAQAQKVGAQWPINAEASAKQLSKKGMTIESKDVKGQVTLVGVKTVNNVPCLDLSVDFSLANVPMPGGELPPGATVKGTAKGTMKGVVPVDPSLPAMGKAGEMKVDMEVNTPAGGPGPAMNIKVNAKMTMTQESTPVK